jgi:1,4-alpha-glucan branching enzyme
LPVTSIVAGQWHEILNSNSKNYGGTGYANHENLQSNNGHIELNIIPAHTIIVLKKTSLK